MREPGHIEKPAGSDPTSLTTQQLLREISSLKELIFVRLEGIDTGIKVAHDDLVRVPTDVQKQVGGLKELLLLKMDDWERRNSEKAAEIDKRFAFVEQARVEQKKDTATAVDAALKAAKEAVTEQNTSNAIAISKSEAATIKQIDQQGLQIAAIAKSIDLQISDAKDRLTKIEAAILGYETLKVQLSGLKSVTDKGEGRSAGIAQFIGWIVAGVTIIGFILKMLTDK